jgi:hypothetical protein
LLSSGVEPSNRLSPVNDGGVGPAAWLGGATSAAAPISAAAAAHANLFMDPPGGFGAADPLSTWLIVRLPAHFWPRISTAPVRAG